MLDAPDSPLAQVLFLFTGTSPTARTDAAEDARTAGTASPPHSPRAARPSPSAASSRRTYPNRTAHPRVIASEHGYAMATAPEGLTALAVPVHTDRGTPTRP